jgi:hypothetical protein
MRSRSFARYTVALKTLVLGNILRVDSDKQRHDDTESVSELFEGQPISFKHGEDPRCANDRHCNGTSAISYMNNILSPTPRTVLDSF